MNKIHALIYAYNNDDGCGSIKDKDDEGTMMITTLTDGGDNDDNDGGGDGDDDNRDDDNSDGDKNDEDAHMIMSIPCLKLIRYWHRN